MRGVFDRAVSLAKVVVAEIRTENVTFIAGSIAYSAFISLLPLLLFLLFVLSAIGNQTFTESVIELTRSFLAPNAQGILMDALTNASARTSASVVGLITLLWGTLKIFRGLDTAFSQIYGTTNESSLLDQIRDGLIVLVSVGLAIGAAVVTGAIFALFPRIPFIGIVNPVLLLVGLVLAFFPMYYVFPDVDLEPREVLPGVVFAAVGWSILEAIFQGYAIFADKYEVYGAVGSILVIVTWLYFSGLVLLTGAVINAVLAGRTGDEVIDERSSVEDENGEQPAEKGSGTATDREADELASRYAELERAHEYLRRAHRNRVREVKRLRDEREWYRQPVWVRAKWWVFGRPDGGRDTEALARGE